MKITFIGHASILVETNELRILSDPWWEGPCFGTQWWVYPFAYTHPVAKEAVDYIYISHGHHDHLHMGTLRRLPKGATYLVSDELDIALFLREQGFNVREVGRNEEVDLGNGVSCRIVQTCYDDTMMSLTDGHEVLVNLNDALHSAPRSIQNNMLDFLKTTYGEIDYAFCGYGIASHFPCCYSVPHMDKKRTAANRQAYFNRQWVYLMDKLSPKMAFPFAADVVLLEDELIWSNEPIHNTERPTDVFNQLYPNAKTQAIDIAPAFHVEKGDIKNNALFEPVCHEKLKKDHERAITISNRKPKKSPEGITSIVTAIKQNIKTSEDYLLEFSKNYAFLIILKGENSAIKIIKKNNHIDVSLVQRPTIGMNDYDLTLTVRYAYLRRCLSTDFGHEVLYVGSGCIFEYATSDRLRENLHNEIKMIIRKQNKAPKSRYGDQPKWLFDIKQLVNKIRGHKKEDLYDLNKWLIIKK